MANDVFNRKTDVFGGSFTADSSWISFPKLGDDGGEIGLLVQQLAVAYQQRVTRIFEVGHAAVYYVGGPTSGTIGIERALGPKAVSEAFYKTFGDVCNAKTNTLDFKLGIGCGNTRLASVSYTATMCVLTTIGLRVTAQDMLINESLQLMTSNVQYTQSNS